MQRTRSTAVWGSGIIAFVACQVLSMAMGTGVALAGGPDSAGWTAAKPELDALKAELQPKKDAIEAQMKQLKDRTIALGVKQKALTEDWKKLAQSMKNGSGGTDVETQKAALKARGDAYRAEWQQIKSERQAAEQQEKTLMAEFKQRWNAILQAHGIQPKSEESGQAPGQGQPTASPVPSGKP